MNPIVKGSNEFTPHEKAPETQPAFSGGPPEPPPRPPKRTAQDVLEPDGMGKTIYLGELTEVSELAVMLGLKSFKVVAELMELREFKHANEFVKFSVASEIATTHGFIVERLF